MVEKSPKWFAYVSVVHVGTWTYIIHVPVSDHGKINVNITHVHTGVSAILPLNILPLMITIPHSETHQSAGS